jgi:uncharacterized membrane protein
MPENTFCTLFGRSLSVSRVTPSTGAMAEAYRYRWVRLVFVIETVIVILLGITDLLTTSKLPPGALAEPLATLAMALNVAILTLMLTLALRDGQSGWRQCRRAGLHMTLYGDATPDSAWKGGVFYYNPDDPALVVEKRSGLGWTVNLGHAQAKFVLIGLLLVPLVLSLLPFLAKP